MSIRSVWKYDFPIRQAASVRGYPTAMPRGARFLHCAVQYSDDRISAWFEVDLEAPHVGRQFRVFGTGDIIDTSELSYLGTTLHQSGTLVLHLYGEIPT